jgi:hypothetical protein
MNEIKKKMCPVCGNPFYYNSIGRRTIRYRNKLGRGKNAVTCSKRCSFIYTRIQNRIVSRYLEREEVLENKIKRLENELGKYVTIK